MRAKEMVDDLRRLGPQDTSVLFHYLADNAIRARLADGQRLCDVGDFIAWLRELAEQAKVHVVSNNRALGALIADGKDVMTIDQVRNELGTWPEVMEIDDICPRCGHLHQGDSECGLPMGGGRICRCELSVRI